MCLFVVLLFSEKERTPNVDIDVCCLGVGRTQITPTGKTDK